MPAYYSMDFYYKVDINDDFVDSVYRRIMKSNILFLSGCYESESMTYQEIVSYNQNLLNTKFKLGFTQDSKEGYKQVYFSHDYFAEVRCFWIHYNDYILFSVIVPESDIFVDDEDSNLFIEYKLDLLKEMSIDLMNLPGSIAVQTSNEASGPFSLSKVEQCNLSSVPFAIINKANLQIEISGKTRVINGQLYLIER